MTDFTVGDWVEYTAARLARDDPRLSPMDIARSVYLELSGIHVGILSRAPPEIRREFLETLLLSVVGIINDLETVQGERTKSWIDELRRATAMGAEP